MPSIVETIREVVRRELERIYTLELGIVTAVFPHTAEDDQDNYQCSVTLKNKKQDDGSDFELRKVPVATERVGWAAIPNVGDLVLVSFIGGDINAPIITGRLYNDEDRPPVNDQGQIILDRVDSVLITTTSGVKVEIDPDGNVRIDSDKGNDKKIIINGGENGALRKSDTITAEIPKGQVLTAADNGIPNKAAIPVTVTIETSSETVLIGD